uniref:FERM domain-containing protein n=1 Tax=Rhabditophanes sp. KR3021 TaxID=114890 RepID=A0AC35TJ52_9BILA
MVANESSMTSPSCANSHLDFSISEDRTAKSPILDSSTAGKMSLFSRISTKAGFKMSNHIVVTVQLLNAEATIQHEFKKSATGKDVLDWVCGHLDIVEKYFFGLRFFDDKKNRFWIDLHKNLGKQFDEKRVMLCFRVRFYPPAPTELKEEITRYHIFLQICRDLLHGRLCCPSTLSAKLGGLILQATLGDFDQKIHSGNYVSQYRLVVKQTESLENKIQDYHKSFVGYTPAKCEIDLLVLVCQLETYGFDPYTVQFKNSHNEQTYIGATPKGVLIFEGHEVKHVLLWNDIDKTTFFGREYKIVVTNEYARRHIDLCEKSSSLKSSSLSRANSGLEINHHNVIKAKCCKRDFCKHLWQHILAQKAFYTAETAIAVKPIFSKPFIPLFTRGSTFRSQTSKTYHEFEQEEPTREQPTHFFRCQLQKHKSRDDNQLSNPEYDLLVKEHKKSVEDAIREKSVDDLLNEQPKKEEELARSEEEDIPDTHNLTLESIKEETSSKSFVTTPNKHFRQKQPNQTDYVLCQ